MSRSASRIEKVIKDLQDGYMNSSYPKVLEEGVEDITEQKLLSVIIPARNEFPSCPFTVHSILNAWESDGYDWKDLEIIVVDNCSDEQSIDPKYYTHPADHGTLTYLYDRRIYWAGILRTHYYPIAGNHAARNEGAKIARGKYVFFSDAHMSYGQGFFKKMMQTTEESGGLVHGAISWMGGYPVKAGDSGVGLQYTLKLGEEIKGTWTPYLVGNGKDWFYIAAQGHCSVMCNRRQFLDFGGYPKIHRSYGGGEFYTDLKWWMYGSTVAVHPEAIGYHLKSYRGYSWTHDDYIHNVLNIGYALGMDEWVERAYLNWLRNGRREVLEKMWTEAQKEMQSDREEIAKRRVKTFNEVLVERPWDIKNMEKHGTKNSSVLIFHHTWISLLSNAPKFVQDMYNNSQLQKDLDKFIREKLWNCVYKPSLDKKDAQ